MIKKKVFFKIIVIIAVILILGVVFSFIFFKDNVTEVYKEYILKCSQCPYISEPAPTYCPMGVITTNENACGCISYSCIEE